MKIHTLLTAFRHLYENESNSTEISQDYESMAKYISEKKDLKPLDFIQLLNDFTNKTGTYIIPYRYETEEYRELIEGTRYTLLLHNKNFDSIFLYQPQENTHPKIYKFHLNSKLLIDDIPEQDILEENGEVTAYIFSKTKSLFEPSDKSSKKDHKDKETDGHKDKRKPIQLLFDLLRPDSKEIIFLYLYAIFGGLISLSLPLGIQSIIGLVMGAQYSSSLFLMIFLVLMGVLVAGLMQIMQIWLVESIQQRIFVRSAFEFAYKAPKIKLEALLDKYAPELMNRFFDTVNIQKSLPKILIDFTQANLQILFGLILLSFYHPLFLVFGGFLLGVFYLIFRLTGPSGMKASVKESKYKYEVAFWLEEIARTMRIFKVAGNTNLPLEKTDLLVSNYVDARKKHFKVLATQFSYMVVFKILVTGSLLIMGSVLIMRQQINIGQFVASEIIIILILNAIEKVILSLENIYDVLTSVDKLASVTELPLDRVDGVPFNYIDTGLGMQLDFNIQNYKSLKSNYNILHNIDLHIKPGEKICITGPNGSGKSSLLALTTGLYSHYEGLLLFNGLPINNINLRSLHDFMAQNFAREMVFRGTLFENITLGRRDIPMADVMWAIELTGLDELMKKLPKGLDTELSPEDRNIPDSELAKIVLARCIAERPRLLLLEEFLDIFDFKHRKIMVDYIIGLGESTTVMAISNDPDFASKCDRVIVMDKGTVIFDGKFEDIRKEQYLKSMFYSMF
jgi:ABC-type bacteriocin/lantibiotic exporter with double-glycine peptidase domain